MKAMRRGAGMKQTSEAVFAPDWLSLREPADHAARDADLLARAAACVKPGQAVLDLGSGTGSTARAFAHAGFDGLRWRFFDNDQTLLQVAQSKAPDAECVLGDLSALDDLPLDGVGLISASALFDLMPRDWVANLVARATARGIPIYAALNYSGVMTWSPADPRDAVITNAFNNHQGRDKGLGVALGPASGPVLATISRAHGYDAEMADSPWVLTADHAAMQQMLIDGIADAAYEAGAAEAKQWAAHRQAAIQTTQAEIGHTDVLALPK